MGLTGESPVSLRWESNIMTLCPHEMRNELSSKRIALLLVTDREHLREAIASSVKEESFHLVMCESPEIIEQILARRSIDLVLIDLRFEAMTAMELCLQILRAHTALEVVLISEETTPHEIVTGFACGAADVITGSHLESEVLQARLRRIIKGRVPIKPLATPTEPGLHYGPIALYASRYAAYVDGRSLHLTVREFQVLLYLINNAQRIASRRDLVYACGQHDQDVSDRAIDNLILRLRKKLGRYGSLIVSMRGVGYSMAPLSGADEPDSPADE